MTVIVVVALFALFITMLMVMTVIVVVAFRALLITMLMVMTVIVRRVLHALGSRQTGDRDGVDDGRLMIGSFEHRRHEGVVAAAVDDDEVRLRQRQLVLRSGLIVVRILRRIVDDRRHLGSITDDALDDVGVDIRRGHDREVPISGRVVGIPTTSQRDERTGCQHGKGGSAK